MKYFAKYLSLKYDLKDSHWQRARNNTIKAYD